MSLLFQAYYSYSIMFSFTGFPIIFDSSEKQVQKKKIKGENTTTNRKDTVRLKASPVSK